MLEYSLNPKEGFLLVVKTVAELCTVKNLWCKQLNLSSYQCSTLTQTFQAGKTREVGTLKVICLITLVGFAQGLDQSSDKRTVCCVTVEGRARNSSLNHNQRLAFNATHVQAQETSIVHAFPPSYLLQWCSIADK